MRERWQTVLGAGDSSRCLLVWFFCLLATLTPHGPPRPNFCWNQILPSRSRNQTDFPSVKYCILLAPLTKSNESASSWTIRPVDMAPNVWAREPALGAEYHHMPR